MTETYEIDKSGFESNPLPNEFISDLSKSFGAFFSKDELSFVSFYSYLFAYSEEHMQKDLNRGLAILDEFGADKLNRARIMIYTKLISFSLLSNDKIVYNTGIVQMIDLIKLLESNGDHDYIDLKLLAGYSIVLPFLLKTESVELFGKYGEEFIKLSSKWREDKEKVCEVYERICMYYFKKNLNEKALNLTK